MIRKEILTLTAICAVLLIQLTFLTSHFTYADDLPSGVTVKTQQSPPKSIQTQTLYVPRTDFLNMPECNETHQIIGIWANVDTTVHGAIFHYVSNTMEFSVPVDSDSKTLITFDYPVYEPIPNITIQSEDHYYDKGYVGFVCYNYTKEQTSLGTESTVTKTVPLQTEQVQKTASREPTLSANINRITIGLDPSYVAVNSITNTLYVVNQDQNSLSVIGGSDRDGLGTTVQVGDRPDGIAVNEISNMIYVINHDSNDTTVIDGSSNKIISTISLDSKPDVIDVNSNTNMIYVASEDKFLTVIDGSKNQIVKKIAIEDTPYNIAINPKNNIIYITNPNLNSVSVIDDSQNKIIADIQVEKRPGGIVVNSPSNVIYVTNQGSASLSVIDGSKNTMIGNLGVGDNPTGLAFNPNTNRLYVATDAAMFVVDTTTNSVSNYLKIYSTFSIGINTKTNTVYASQPSSHDIAVIDGASGSQLYTVGKDYGPSAIAANEKTGMIYVANGGSGTVSVIDGNKNRVVTSIKVGTSPSAISVNQETNMVYVAEPGSNSISIIDGSLNTVVSKLVVGEDFDAYKISKMNFSRTYEASSKPNSIAMDTNNNLIYVANAGNTIFVNSEKKSMYFNGPDVSDTGMGQLVVIDGKSNTFKITTTDHPPFSKIVFDNEKNKIHGIGNNNDRFAIAIDNHLHRIYLAQHSIWSSESEKINGSLIILNPEEKVLTKIEVGKEPNAIAVNEENSQVFVVNAKSNSVSLVDGIKMKLLGNISIDTNPTAIAINSKTNTVYVTHESNYITVITHPQIESNLPPNNEKYQIELRGNIDDFTIDTDRNMIYALIGNEISVIDGSKNVVVDTIPTRHETGATTAIAVNPKTNMIYAGSDFLNVVDGNQRKLIATFPIPGESIGINSKTNTIYIHDYDTVYKVDGSTNQIVDTIKVDADYGGIRKLLIDENTNTFFVAYPVKDKPISLLVMDGSNDKQIATIQYGDSWYSNYDLAVNPDTQTLYAVEGSFHLYLIDLQSNTLSKDIPLPLGTGNLVSVEADTKTNLVYLFSNDNHKISIVDGTSNSVISSIDVDISSSKMEINQKTNKIYFSAGKFLDVIPGYEGPQGSGNSQTNNNSMLQIAMPNWIKKDAKWWHDGSLGNDEFIKGIQYMIQNGIITIPQTQTSSSSSTSIPSWIKNNAGLWSDGQISDDEFVKGIQWLVQNGVINVKS